MRKAIYLFIVTSLKNKNLLYIQKVELKLIRVLVEVEVPNSIQGRL